MECWCSWPNNIKWSQWGEKRLNLAKVVIQGSFQTFCLLSLSHYCFNLLNIHLNACFRLVLKVKPWIYILLVEAPLLSGFRGIWFLEDSHWHGTKWVLWYLYATLQKKIHLLKFWGQPRTSWNLFLLLNKNDLEKKPIVIVLGKLLTYTKKLV